jgi:hypothetical protein
MPSLTLRVAFLSASPPDNQRDAERPTRLFPRRASERALSQAVSGFIRQKRALHATDAPKGPPQINQPRATPGGPRKRPCRPSQLGGGSRCPPSPKWCERGCDETCCIELGASSQLGTFATGSPRAASTTSLARSPAQRVGGMCGPDLESLNSCLSRGQSAYAQRLHHPGPPRRRNRPSAPTRIRAAGFPKTPYAPRNTPAGAGIGTRRLLDVTLYPVITPASDQ